MNKPLIIGVLALQGAFSKHMEKVEKLGAAAQEIRRPQELDNCDALIIPGGESTTISRQLQSQEMVESIQAFAKEHPIFGTCAGLILMAHRVESSVPIQSLGLLDVSVRRNAYGRQKESFITQLSLNSDAFERQTVQALFIRAPKINHLGEKVQVLANLDEDPVFIQQGHFLATTFHPELTEQMTIHRYFLDLVSQV